MKKIDKFCKHLETHLPINYNPSSSNTLHFIQKKFIARLGVEEITILNFEKQLKDSAGQSQIERVAELINDLRRTIEETVPSAYAKAINEDDEHAIEEYTLELEKADFDVLTLFETGSKQAESSNIEKARKTAIKTLLVARFDRCVKRGETQQGVALFKTLGPQYSNHPLTLLTQYRQSHATEAEKPFCTTVKRELLVDFHSNELNSSILAHDIDAFLKAIQLAEKPYLLGDVKRVIRDPSLLEYAYFKVQEIFSALLIDNKYEDLIDQLFDNLNIPQPYGHCLEDAIGLAKEKASEKEALDRFNRLWAEATLHWKSLFGDLSSDVQKKVINSVLELSLLRKSWAGFLSLFLIADSRDLATIRKDYLQKFQKFLKEGTFDQSFFQALIEIRDVFNAYRLLNDAYAANENQGGVLTETLFNFFAAGKGSELSWEMTYAYAYGCAELAKDPTARYLPKNFRCPLSIFIATKDSFAISPPQIPNEGHFKKQRRVDYLSKEVSMESSTTHPSQCASITQVALCTLKSGKSLPAKELEVLKAVQPYPNFVNLIGDPVTYFKDSPLERHEKIAFLCNLFDGDLYYYAERKMSNQPLSRPPLTNGLLLKYLQGLADGLFVLHNKLKIFHHDIKAENILCNNEGIGIADFGKARDLEDLTSSFYGTFSLSAPEMFLGEPYERAPTDMWAAGILIMEVVEKIPTLPWEADLTAIKKARGNIRELISKMIGTMTENAEYLQSTRGTTVTDQLKRIAGQLLEVEPSDRMTAAQLSAAIKEISLNLPPEMASKEI